jgi:BirA family transcriptional regulator, biotin operon repressor / biotin---[acetyl-CoA-carboxylase] ligase
MLDELTEWEHLLGPLCAESRVRLWCLDKTTSTMDAAKQNYAAVHEGQWGLVIAREQTAGRGRQGRAWVSPPGGFWGTAWFTTSKSLAELQGLSLVVGCALARACAHCGATVKLKWPNDLFSEDGAKLGGVLIESGQCDAHHVTVFIGIGVNLLTLPDNVQKGESLLRRFGAGTTPPEFATYLIPYLKAAVTQFLESGFRPFRAEWLSCAYGLHSEFEVKSYPGSPRGYLHGVTESGELQLRTPGGVITITTGEVCSV